MATKKKVVAKVEEAVEEVKQEEVAEVVVAPAVVTETEKALAPDFRKEELATNLAKVTRRSQDIH
jgi:hypothetical protein